MTQNRDDEAWSDPLCPLWCTTDHGEQKHDEDAWHFNDVVVVPVIELQVSYRDGYESRTIGVDIDVGIERQVGGSETFIHFGVGEERERHFRLSRESAQRLVQALARTIQVAGLSRDEECVSRLLE